MDGRFFHKIWDAPIFHRKFIFLFHCNASVNLIDRCVCNSSRCVGKVMTMRCAKLGRSMCVCVCVCVCECVCVCVRERERERERKRERGGGLAA
jgi:hypothetical protein